MPPPWEQARLPWDAAPNGPWAEAADAGEGGKANKKDAKRVIAGKEVGCKFFMLFHTGFVSDEGKLGVPLPMMDKAFKNKKNKYRKEGVATLHFAMAGETATAEVEVADGASERV